MQRDIINTSAIVKYLVSRSGGFMIPTSQPNRLHARPLMSTSMSQNYLRNQKSPSSSLECLRDGVMLRRGARKLAGGSEQSEVHSTN